MSKLTCESEFFGKLPTGEDVTLYRITGGKGVVTEIISYGAIIHSLRVPDRNGRTADVVLGQDNIEGYLGRRPCAAAVIGRVANRISGARFDVSGKTVKLAANFGDDLLHSGDGNYAKRVFSGKAFSGDDSAGVVLSLTDSGEAGFPGKVDVTVTYSLDQEGSLHLVYTALPEMDTPVSLTNHAYFNLAGHESGQVGGHIMQLDSDFITPNDGRAMTTGEVRPVAGTDFDYTSPRSLGSAFESKDVLLTQFGGGFDMNFCIRGRGMRRGGSFTDPASGRSMEFFTDLPGVQIFTMPSLPEGVLGKGGAHYVANGAFCAETQFYPDATNLSQFPSPFLKAGERFVTETVYRFPHL